MNSENIRRNMEFIVEQQARITAHVEELQEYRKRNEPQWDAFQKSFVQLVELTRIMDERMDIGDFRITAVEDRSTVLETRSAALEASMARLAEAQAHADEAQAHADERVSALIDIIIEGRNGPS